MAAIPFSACYELKDMDLVKVVFDCMGKQVVVFRSDRKWKLPSPGSWISSKRIVGCLLGETYLTYNTHEQIAMEDFVCDIAHCIDSLLCNLEPVVREIQKRRQANAITHHHSDACMPAVDKGESTFVYVMKHNNGLFKIGKSVNPKAREKTLQAEDPRLEMIACAPCGGQVETRLHKIFAEKRIRGEWFSLEHNHVDWVLTYLQMKSMKGIESGAN